MSAQDEVKAYFLERAHINPRSPKVIEAIEKRIARRLLEGFTVADLKRVVDFANVDQFYLDNEYNKQAIVIFKNAERVESILQRIKTIQAQREARMFL